MKISVIISTILIAQVSASFFDVFKGAVTSVQNSFGKLITDVATDVRETVDCTILAVEHVLALSEDATARYYEKCGGANTTYAASKAQPDGISPKVELTLEILNKEEVLHKEIPNEIDAKINESVSKVLDNYNSHANLISVEDVLAADSKRLGEVSDLVKQELQKLSNKVNGDFKDIKQKDSEPSVDTILQEIKLLESRERNSKNVSEANEIHKVIDEVLGKLNIIEATEATENGKLELILKDLENNSNNSFVDLRQQFNEWKEEESKHLDAIKNKIQEHENFAGHIHEKDLNYTQPVQLNIEIHNDSNPPKITANIVGYTDTAMQHNSYDVESNEVPFSEVLTNAYNVTPSSINVTSINNVKFTTDLLLSTQEAPSKVQSTQKVVGSTTNPKTTDGNEQTFVTNQPMSTPNMFNDNKLNNNVITPTPFPITESVFHPILNTTHFRNEESLELTTYGSTSTTLLKTNYSNEYSTTSPISLVTKPASHNIHPLAITTSSGNEKSTITISNSTRNEAVPLIESITHFGYGESSTLSMNRSTTAILNDNDFNNTIITSTSFPLRIPESKNNQPGTFASGYEQSSTLTTNKRKTTKQQNIDNDDINTTVTSTSFPVSIPETTEPVKLTTTSMIVEGALVSKINQQFKSPTTAQNNESSTLTTDSTKTILNTLNDILITSTLSPTYIQPIENATSAVSQESTILAPKDIVSAKTSYDGMLQTTNTTLTTTEKINANNTNRLLGNTMGPENEATLNRPDIPVNLGLVPFADSPIAFPIITDEYTTPVITHMYAPKSLNPQRLNNKDPSFRPLNQNVKRSSPLVNGSPVYKYRPPIALTTYRPLSETPRGTNNHNKAPDSFLNNSPSHSEAYLQVLREARELIENSKRSSRIMNSILSNRKNYRAPSVFNN